MAILCVVAACATARQQSSPAAEREERDERAVYAAVISRVAEEHMAKQLVLLAKTIAITQDLFSGPPCDDEGKYYGLCAALAGSKPARIMPLKTLTTPFEVAVRVDLLRGGYEEAFRCDPGVPPAKLGGNWHCFHSRFPDAAGILSLSRIAFDGDYTKAVVYTEFTCGGLCGSGEMYLLEKRGQSWVVVDSREIWIS